MNFSFPFRPSSVVRWFLALWLFACPMTGMGAEHWPLEAVDDSLVARGEFKTAAGADGACLVFDGGSVIEAKRTSVLGGVFTLSIWFNPYVIEGQQQMIVGKNRYSRAEREWSLTLEPDGKLRAHLQQEGWRTISGRAELKPGHWHWVTLVVEANRAALYLNGGLEGEVKLKSPITITDAPITFGGIFDQGRVTQPLHGALDEVRFMPRALEAKEIAAAYRSVESTHDLPPSKVADFPLWDASVKLVEAKDLPVLEGVTFHVIKKWDQPGDGYTFLHGVGLAWHKGRLYASIGHNKGAENTVTEEAQYRVSADGGKTWSDLRVIDAGDEPDLAVSHGVFHSLGGKLWAFHGAYYQKMERIHTRAYSLNDDSGQWVKHGVVIENGFWALNPPVKMSDGNWIMPGISAGVYSESGTHPAAVAISHGDDLLSWDFVSIPTHKGMKMWGESGIIVEGAEVLNVARYGAKPLALISRSADHGRTWSTMGESNLPMTTSKPATGVLSTGQRYLVCTTAANNGGRRFPLTIAVSKPGSALLSRVFVIRHAVHNGQGESHPKASLSYPCATEHEGRLYVGFSNNGGRGGNHNSAEMAVIPIESLR